MTRDAPFARNPHVPSGASPHFVLVIGGSDTGVGKTHVTTRLLRALRERSLRVAAFKPLESGCDRLPDGSLVPADATLLREAAGAWQPLDDVCPWRLAPPIAPAQALLDEGTTITEADVLDAATRAVADADLLVCETAGGVCSPITPSLDGRALARLFDAPLLLIVRDRLGAIHQACAALDALHARGVTPLAVVLNRFAADEGPFGADNARWIERAHPEIPVFVTDANDPLTDLAVFVAARLRPPA